MLVTKHWVPLHSPGMLLVCLRAVQEASGAGAGSSGTPALLLKSQGLSTRTNLAAPASPCYSFWFQSLFLIIVSVYVSDILQRAFLIYESVYEWSSHLPSSHQSPCGLEGDKITWHLVGRCRIHLVGWGMGLGNRENGSRKALGKAKWG